MRAFIGRRRGLALAASVALVLGTGVSAYAGVGRAAPAPRAAGSLAGLPSGVAQAADRAEPTLPAPKGWPFDETFSRTSGTGRLGGGADFWTDWVYDDHGASSSSGLPLASNLTVGDDLAPAQGVDTYAGATDTYWRVDWNTLADPTVPIAEWTFDTDDDATTGGSAWPADAGVSSPGIEDALVVSAAGARLIDVVSGAVLGTFATKVDTSARSFVVRIPRRTLPVSATWRIRLGSGVASADGQTFATPSTYQGLPQDGTSRLYNITFRTTAQEPPVVTDARTDALVASVGAILAASPVVGDMLGADGATRLVTGNFWDDDDQADTLAGGDVSAFSLPVDWSALESHQKTPEPLVRGYSQRWYVTDLDLGQGVADNPPGAGDFLPNYLGRIQPYSVYVPLDYTGRKALPLTWVLHSLSVNYNQYGALDPAQLQEECEGRDSICATTEGFGPDGWYLDEAQHDFFQVWRQLALGYRLDPERTVMSGYSMGGYASYLLTMTYPQLFAEAMALAGPPTCGVQVVGPIRSGTGADCENDGPTGPLVGNVRWVPYVMADGVADELVPYSSVLEQIQAFTAAGLRYHFVSYPTEDHLGYAAQDRFAAEVDLLGGTPARQTNPGRIDYAFYPELQNAALGLGPTSVYWLSGLTGRTSGDGTVASVSALDGALPMPTETVSTTVKPLAADPTPAVETDETWTAGGTPAATRTLALTLTDVGSVTVDTGAARLPHAVATVVADGAGQLTLTRLAPGTVVTLAGQTVVAAGDGTAVLTVPGGTSTATW